MFARIGIWLGSNEELDRWITRSRDQVKPSLQSQAGVAGAYWLVDRAGQKALTITLWKSESALRASDAFAARTQATTASVSGAQVTTERFEIVDRL
jgi:hypothetical protein